MLTSTICSNSSHLGFTICLTIKPVEGFSRHSRLAEDPWKDSLHTFSAPTTRRFQTGFSRPNRERSRAAFWASSNEASASKSPPITISYITSSISSNSTQPVCVWLCVCMLMNSSQFILRSEQHACKVSYTPTVFLLGMASVHITTQAYPEQQ
jgi:hypothetical protein